MRTTLDIEDDILLAAKEIARRQGHSMGKVISDLARQALTRDLKLDTRNGVPLFPVRPASGIVSLEIVKEIMNS